MDLLNYDTIWGLLESVALSVFVACIGRIQYLVAGDIQLNTRSLLHTRLVDAL